MSWTIKQGGGTCGADEWAVINDETDETEGCHATEEEARAQVAELEGAETDGPPADDEVQDELAAVVAAAALCRTPDEAVLATSRPGARAFHLGRRYETTRAVNPDAAARVLAEVRNLPNLNAAGEPDAAAAGPGRFELVMVPEGVRSTDDREIAPGALGTRALPLPFMFVTVTGWGHDGAELAGRIETADLVDGEWRGTGTYSSLEPGQRCRQLVEEQTLRFVSADLEVWEWELLEEGTCDDWDNLFDGSCRLVERVLAGNIMGATGCPFPAFPQCVVVPEGVGIPDAQEGGRTTAAALAAADLTPAPTCRPGGGCCDSCGDHALTAAGYHLPEAIPAEWFDDPSDLLATMPPGDRKHVTPEGRVYGWCATFETSHIGFPNANITPPHSTADYAYFRTGRLWAHRDGEEVAVPVGQLTMGVGHPQNAQASAAQAKAHYDGGPGAVQVADVAVGENETGIWFAGAMRNGITDDQLRTFLATDESGDWRPIAGKNELVGIASGVVVPGFPVSQRALAASGAVEVFTVHPRAVMVEGEVVSLVAAGMRPSDPVATRLARLEARFDREVGALRASVAPLVPLSVTALRERVANGHP